jgi:hypothetical protein
VPMARANSVPMEERMQGLDVSEPGGPHRGGWMTVGNGLVQGRVGSEPTREGEECTNLDGPASSPAHLRFVHPSSGG